MYLTNIRQNMCFVVNTLSQYMVEPRHVHLVAAKHAMRYLKGTLDCGLRYTTNNEFRLCIYTDLDWVRSVGDRNSTSGCCFSLGSGVISWLSRKQTSVVLNTTEAEYIATCSACSEAVWFHKLSTWLFDTKMDATNIYYDNQRCIKLTKNPVFHDKSNHIEIKYHYIQDIVRRRAINLQHAPMEE